MVVGVDADRGGDGHGLAGDRLGVEVGSSKRAGGGEREIAARADAHDIVVGLEHVAVAGQDQALVGVGDDHHGLETAEITVGAPVLGELDASALELIGEALELGLKPLEQGEGVGGGAGEARDDVAVADAADLLGVALDDGLAEGDLAVAGDHHLAAFADGEDGRAVPGVGGLAHCCTAISAWRGFVKRYNPHPHLPPKREGIS